MSGSCPTENLAPPREPIAIVGIGCRLPGGIRDAQSFWEVLVGGVDTVGEVPDDRPDLAGGALTNRSGGFLADVANFDAAFFGISPREAERIDPQQRLLLEVAWEALEDAGIAPTHLAGSPTSVFVGQWLSDYEAYLFADSARVDFHMTLGSGRYAASGRISRALGLQGPSLTLDTACSSSLVAVHLACQSLWSRETDLALASGVNVILQPQISLAYGQSGMLAADGRCKFGDARADGYVRSEGVGVVVLEPLSRARSLGHPIYALIRGSAVNNDGNTSGSLGTPGLEGQVALLRAAYASAQVAPSDVQYVEAHGTGTRAGDPIELGALGHVLGRGRLPAEPLIVGSVKTNIGHTEGAAGVAGLIKVALAMHHGQVPPSLHCRVPAPTVAWAELGVAVGTHPQAWRADRPALAGVSAFGIAGTNAHVVLESAEPVGVLRGVTHAASDGPFVLPLAARAPDAVQALAARYATLLATPDAPDLATVCAVAALRRSDYPTRCAVVGGTLEEISAELASVVAPAYVDDGTSATLTHAGPGVVFVFPGQGGQWLGMGRELLAREPVFAQALDDVARAFAPLVDWRVRDVLTSDDPAWLARIEVVQPLLFAIQVGLAALWRSWGIEPQAVVGHSLGEVAAAYVAGGLTLEDAARVICLRSLLLRRISGQGAMAVVDLSEADARAAIGEFTAEVSIAVSNSIRSTVLAGDPTAMAELQARLERRDVLWQWVRVDVASHSPQVEAILDDLRAGLRDLQPRAVEVPFYSTVTGSAEIGAVFDADYWAHNLRQPVRFGAATQALVDAGVTVFLELSPHPLLAPAIGDTLYAAGRTGAALASLRRNEAGLLVAYRALAELYCRGAAINWAAVMHRQRAPERMLPRYPWQHQRYWYPRPAPRAGADLAAHARMAPGDWLGTPFVSAAQPKARTWTGSMSTLEWPFLRDHRVADAVVLPAAGHVELMLAAGLQLAPAPDGERASSAVQLERVQLGDALVFSGEADREVQVSVGAAGSTTEDLAVYSRDRAADAANAEAWLRHASAHLVAGALDEVHPLGRARERATFEETAGPEHYVRLAARELPYGPSFQSVAQLWRGDDEVQARLVLPSELDADAGAGRIVLLDGCFQLLLAAQEGPTAAEVYVPVAIDHLTQTRVWQPSEGAWGYARVRADDVRGTARDELVGDVQLLDTLGEVLVDVRGLRMRRLASRGCATADKQYEVRWVPLAAPSLAGLTVPPGRWLVLADEGGTADALITRLKERGAECVRVAPDASLGTELAELPGPWRGVVHARALDLRAADAGVLDRVIELGTGSVLATVQALLAAQAEGTAADTPRLWLLTRNAQPAAAAQDTPADDAAPDRHAGVPQASLWGFGRVVANEQPRLRCSLVDLPPSPVVEDAELLAERMCADDRDDQLALRDGLWYAARLVRAPAIDATSEAANVEVPLEPDQSFALAIGEPGALDELHLRGAARRPPAAGEVEIEVSAVGLNFLDVLKALGAYPGLDPSAPIALGGECAGRVAAVGADVRDLSVGDRVVAITPSLSAVGLAGAYVTIPAALAARAPATLDDVQAATLPLVFVTALYALYELGRVRPGERVLIHSAAGGIGLAAIQLVRHARAEPLATAGSVDKREYLRRLGITHVFDSRSLDFAPAVMAATGGQGVDLVLNSLAGEYIPAGLGVLAPRGRFLEIGKRDIHADRRIGLEPFKRNLAFHGIDVAALVDEDPTFVGELLQQVIRLVDEGAISPLPVDVRPIAEAESAFRTMAQARHIGKLALDMRVRPARVRAVSGVSRVRADASYVVTGGLGALGLLAAGWLVDRGARHLLLLSRGAPSSATHAQLDGWRARGVTVTVERVDVADRARLADSLARQRERGPRLAGVIHAAGVLADATVSQLDSASLRAALVPKVLGAWYLHLLTQADDLDFLVLYSSAAALLGTPGQANYAAGNSFLDALAWARQAHGQPALSVNWGPWAEVGLAAASDRRGTRLALRGLGSLAPSDGLAALEALLAETSLTQRAVMPFDAAAWAEATPAARSAPLFDLLRHAAAPTTPARAELPAQLWAIPAGQPRRELLETFVRSQLARVLGLDAARISSGQAFQTLGLDSLLALEFRNRLEAALGVSLSATLVWNYPTVAALVPHLASTLAVPLAASAPESEAPLGSGTGIAADTDAALEGVSDAELAEMLAGELNEVQNLLGSGHG